MRCSAVVVALGVLATAGLDGGNLYVNGTVTTVSGFAPPGSLATLSASGPCWIQPGATVSAVTSGSGGPGMSFSAGSFDDGAEIVLAPARVSSVDVEGGILNSNGGTVGGVSVGDEIFGSLTNNGTVAFGGALHTLAIDVGYTQTGTLAERLGNGTGSGIAPSDVLAIVGSATLGGTLQVTGLGRLNPGQTWNPVTYGSHTGDFAPFIHPQDGNPAWNEVALLNVVEVTN